VGMRVGGNSSGVIADERGVSKSTVKRWLGRARVEGTLANRPRTGRPCKTTPAHDQEMVARAQGLTRAGAAGVSRPVSIPLVEVILFIQ